MVNGRLKCIGGIQHLKAKFGDNYSLKIKTISTDSLSQICAQLTETYPSTAISEKELCFLEAKIPAVDLKLSNLFSFVHELKANFGIIDFSITQTTLDHVFVGMIRDQT